MRNDDTNLIGRRFTEGRCSRLVLEANNESLRAENGRLNAQVAELRAAQIVAGAAQFTATFRLTDAGSAAGRWSRRFRTAALARVARSVPLRPFAPITGMRKRRRMRQLSRTTA